jgi:hypothetical protein
MVQSFPPGHKFYGSTTTTVAVRRAMQHAREPESTRQGLRDQSEDRRQMEKAVIHRRSANRAERATLDRPFWGLLRCLAGFFCGMLTFEFAAGADGKRLPALPMTVIAGCEAVVVFSVWP